MLLDLESKKMTQSLEMYDLLTLNKIAKSIGPTMNIEEARTVAYDFINHCKFFKPSTRKNSERNSKSRLNKIDAENAVANMISTVDIQKYLYNILLKGENLGVKY